MADFTWPMQEAVTAALKASAALKALVGDPARVYDHLPQPSIGQDQYPYVALGEEFTAVDWSTKSFDGTEQTVTFHVFSRYSGSKETKQILSVLHDLLHTQDLSLSGAHLVLMRFSFSTIVRDPDGRTRHGIARYRALVHASSIT